jgi:DNA-binding HxlR family transcriptional regulator
MTTKEILMTIAETETLDAEIREWAEARIAAIDTAREKEAKRRAEKREANKEAETALREAIVGALTDEPQTSTDIQTVISGSFTVTPQKISRVLGEFVEDGAAHKTEVKIDGKRRVAYTK